MLINEIPETGFCFPKDSEQKFIVNGKPNLDLLNHGQVGDRIGIYQSKEDPNMFIQVWFENASIVRALILNIERTK